MSALLKSARLRILALAIGLAGGLLGLSGCATRPVDFGYHASPGGYHHRHYRPYGILGLGLTVDRY